MNCAGPCPSWFDCPKRGCYRDAKARYADASYKAERARGYPAQRAYEHEYDGGTNRITDLPKRSKS